MSFSFNKIKIVQENSSSEMSIEVFLALPMSERVRCILRRQVAFFSDQKPVDARIALAELRLYFENNSPR